MTRALFAFFGLFWATQAYALWGQVVPVCACVCASALSLRTAIT
jgi:hypothetical protein